APDATDEVAEAPPQPESEGLRVGPWPCGRLVVVRRCRGEPAGASLAPGLSQCRTHQDLVARQAPPAPPPRDERRGGRGRSPETVSSGGAISSSSSSSSSRASSTPAW